MKKWVDKKRRPLEFQVGDLVMVKLPPQQFKAYRQVHKGLVRRYEGPFSNRREGGQRVVSSGVASPIEGA